MRKGKNFYPTWREASKAAIKLNLRKSRSYETGHHKDPKLPPKPSICFKDFPGAFEFFGKVNHCKRKKEDCYKTWQEASDAARKLGIRTLDDYKTLYYDDPKLPSRPDITYGDFPGFAKFVGRTRDPKQKDFYTTWQQVVSAARKLNINTVSDYDRLRSGDPKLPYKNLLYKYPSFPGFPLSEVSLEKVA